MWAWMSALSPGSDMDLKEPGRSRKGGILPKPKPQCTSLRTISYSTPSSKKRLKIPSAKKHQERPSGSNEDSTYFWKMTQDKRQLEAAWRRQVTSVRPSQGRAQNTGPSRGQSGMPESFRAIES